MPEDEQGGGGGDQSDDPTGAGSTGNQTDDPGPFGLGTEIRGGDLGRSTRKATLNVDRPAPERE